MIRTVILACLLIGLAGPSPQPPSIQPVPLDFDPADIIDMIYRGQADSAVGILSELERERPDDPLVLLVKTRVERDLLADENENKDYIRERAEPIHAALDRVIDICSDELDRPAPDPIYRYYRGWAWLRKTELYTLSRSFWSAGRAAGKGKSDIEKFLKIEPDHADARGMLGGYLYFADALPGLIKFLGRLLFIPSGDREDGLLLLNEAAGGDGWLSVDWQVALVAIDLVFEGRFEDGVAGFVELDRRYPDYLRFTEALSVVAPLYPLQARALREITSRTVARHIDRRGGRADEDLLKHIRYEMSYADMLYTSPRRALDELSALIEDPPVHPDWVLPACHLNRGALYALMGKIDEARADFELVKADDKMDYFHGVARKYLNDLDEAWRPIDLDDLGFVHLIYENRMDEAKAAIEAYRGKHGEDMLYHFYRGDLALFMQDFPAASRAHEEVLDVEAPAWAQTYQMMSALRIAEVFGHQRRYEDAADYVDESQDYERATYLQNYLILARKDFYERLDKGKITTRPSMLFLTRLNPDPGESRDSVFR